MSSVKTYLDTRSKVKGEFFPLKLSVATHGKAFLVSLKVRLLPPQWDGANVVNHPQGLQLNAYIKEQLVKVNNLLFELEVAQQLYELTFEQVREKVQALFKNAKKKEEKSAPEKPYTFAAHYNLVFRNKINKPRTKEIYDTTLRKIAKFTNIEALTFQDINVAWLNSFNEHLSATVGTNARAIDLRNIRAIYNDAIDNTNKVSLNDYPFRRFKIKRQKTIKRSLTIEQLFYLKNLSWKHLQECADFLMLSFYLIGINIVDILHLTTQSLANNKLIYYRAKTSRLYEFTVPPEAMKIINKYRGKQYLLCWRERYTDYGEFSKHINKHCHIVGEIIGVSALTTYYMRHSWATVAAYLDIPKETIAAALGHGGGSVTDIYINFDVKKIDRANREVIDYLNNYANATILGRV
jgi:site-specific recombinase XerD